jgi:hypothetical protein
MLFGGALVAEPRHALLGARAFGYVSAGFGFGGGGGAGAASPQPAGQNKSGDEEDDETKPKCHGSDRHLGYSGFLFFFIMFNTIFGRFLSDLPSPVAPARKIKGSQPDWKDQKPTINARRENQNPYRDNK